MSQIKKGGPVSRRGPSYKKSVYVYTRDGNLVAAKWPEPRKGNISQKQKDEMERFRQTQWLTKYVPGFIMAEIIDLVAGTTLLPRDLITQGMYGRLFSIGVNGGKVMVPMAFKVDVSTSLDTIGQTEGQMMVRGSALWDPLPQGRVGQRLVSQGPGTAPLWQSVLTGDTEAMITSSFQNEDVTDAMAMSGSFFRPALNISVFSVWAALTLVDTATYHAIIARVAVEDIVEVIWRSSGRVATAAGKEAWVYDLPVPVTLIENQT